MSERGGYQLWMTPEEHKEYIELQKKWSALQKQMGGINRRAKRRMRRSEKSGNIPANVIGAQKITTGIASASLPAPNSGDDSSNENSKIAI